MLGCPCCQGLERLASTRKRIKCRIWSYVWYYVCKVYCSSVALDSKNRHFNHHSDKRIAIFSHPSVKNTVETCQVIRPADARRKLILEISGSLRQRYKLLITLKTYCSFNIKAKTRELGRKYSPGRKCDDQCNETDSCLAWTYSVGIIG